MSDKDLFKTEKRKVKELVPYEFNPRKMREDQVEVLKKSLEQFGLVELPVIDADDTIVAGHQRLRVMAMLGRGEDTIEVRVAKRKLTEEEFQKYNIISNKVVGEFDWDLLANHFDEELLKSAGFKEEDLLTGFGLAKADAEDIDEIRMLVLSVYPPESPRLKERAMIVFDTKEDYDKVKKAVVERPDDVKNALIELAGL